MIAIADAVDEITGVANQTAKHRDELLKAITAVIDGFERIRDSAGYRNPEKREWVSYFLEEIEEEIEAALKRCL